jgi:enoyl-CoA hydratase/carnithine racemase
MKNGAASDQTLMHLTIEQRGPVTVVSLNRPAKRNAINDQMLDSLGQFFSSPPGNTRAIVLAAEGEHFCSGLDLSEHRERDAFATLGSSRRWHKCFELIQYGSVPVVCAMQGAVIGGGLELAASAHVRVASPSCFYAMPEGQRGIFVGGGASVRVARIIGAGRIVDMMLTGRVLNAEEGQALGLSHYLTGPGQELAKAIELAGKIAGNAPLSNYAIIQAIGRIAEMSAAEGLFTESITAALVQTGPEVKKRVNAFLERKRG